MINTLLTSNTSGAHWNLVFWAARNISEKELERRPYRDYDSFADELLAAHRNKPKPKLQELLDATGDDPDVQRKAFEAALLCAAKGYAMYTAKFPDNKEWAVKCFEDAQPSFVELEITTGPVEQVIERDTFAELLNDGISTEYGCSLIGAKELAA